MTPKPYRWCAVPLCTNTSIKTPNKLFVFVPHKETTRNKWINLARRDLPGITSKTQLYFCEDHFDLPNDMVNYMEYHVMGIVSQIRMKPDCLPTKFECQADIVGIEPAEHLNVPRKQKVQESKESSSSSMHSAATNEIKLFCPKCNTDMSHTAEGIQQAQTKTLITRVYHYLEQEYEQLKKLKAKLGPLSKFAQRTALATGVGESTVLEILQEEDMNADKAREPSPKYGRARKRLKQMDSSHEDTDDTMDFKQAAPLASCGQEEEPAVKEQTQVIYVKALSGEEPAVKKVRKKTMFTPGMKKKEPIIYVQALNKQEPAVKKVSKKNKITFTPGLKMKQPIIYVKALNNEQAQTKPISVDVEAEQPDDQINETQSEPVAEPLFVKLESVIFEESGEVEKQGSKQNTDFEKEKLVKSQAQRQKEYRQRKKLENLREKKKPKTNSQRQREFREKQRKNVIGETLDSFLARRKADAERAKRYRENKKQKQKVETLDLNLARKKNNAEHIKIYREKLTSSKKELSSNEDTEQNIEDVGRASCGQDVHAEIDPIAINVKVEPPEDAMNESSRLGEAKVKLEIEIGEEGFS